MNPKKPPLVRQAIHYHVNDLAELQHTLEGKAHLYIVNKRKHPRAFKETTMKVVANCTFEELTQFIKDAGYLTHAVNKKLNYIKVVGKKHKSTIFVDALKSTSPGMILEEIEQGMVGNYAHHLFYAWRESGLLEHIFPELHDCVAVDGGGHHNETVFEHLMDCLMWAKDYPVNLQWAVLLHDIGKPATMSTGKDANGKVKISFHQHEVVGASIAYNVCKRFGFSEKDSKYVVTLVRHHMFRFHRDSADKTIKKWLFKVGKNNWQDLFQLRIADRKGNRANKNKPAVTREMRELEKKIKSLVSQGQCIFREDLNLPEKELKDLLRGTKIQTKEVYTNLIGLVNSDASRNSEVWLKNYVRRIYRNKKSDENTISEVR